jgi:hypothetical protein
MGLIGTYTDPHILIAYSDGEVRQEFTFVYAAEIESGELKIDDESKEAAWVDPFLGSRAATGRIATAQAEGRHGVSEGPADVFKVTPMSLRHCAHYCFREFLKKASPYLLREPSYHFRANTMNTSECMTDDAF